MTHTWKVVRIALNSRMIVFLLQIAFNHLVPDHNADAFVGHQFTPPQTNSDWLVQHTLGGFSNWDARYFLSIAKNGYLKEQWIAFFPFYPLLIMYTTNALQYISFVTLTYPYAYILAGFLINVLAFTFAATALYKLTVLLHRNQQFALASVKWFCYNPASVFFSACYTESVYAALVFSGMYAVNRRANVNSFQQKWNYFLAAMAFTIASLTRSNGITNILFLLYPLVLWHFMNALQRQLWVKSYTLKQITLTLFVLILSAFVLLPYVLVQLDAHASFCQTKEDQLKSFCNQHPLDVYAYVQETYWSVGLFQYYQWRKVPLFMLAFPMLAFVFYSFLRFWKENKAMLKRNFLNFSAYKFRRENEYWNRVEILLPYLIHTAFLCSFALLFINVEVITRLIASSTPFIYWNAAALEKKEQVFLKWYFALYFFLGILLHCNFYPWT